MTENKALSHLYSRKATELLPRTTDFYLSLQSAPKLSNTSFIARSWGILTQYLEIVVMWQPSYRYSQRLSSGLEAGEQIDAILLDFSRAFDKALKTCHEALSLCHSRDDSPMDHKLSFQQFLLNIVHHRLHPPHLQCPTRHCPCTHALPSLHQLHSWESVVNNPPIHWWLSPF